MSDKVPKEKWSSFDFIPCMLNELEIFRIKKIYKQELRSSQ